MVCVLVAAVAVIVGLAMVGAVGATPAADAQALHALTVEVRGLPSMCLSAAPQPPLGRITRPSDRFELRGPTRRTTRSAGRLLATATRVVSINHGCSLHVEFRIAEKLGAFSFYDASNGDIWFGFNSNSLPRHNWKLTIVER